MKLNIFGNQPIITPRDPQLPMEAANKNYVDNSILAHSDNVSLHLTPVQNTLLDNITVTHTEVNQLAGVTSNVQTQISARVTRSGDTLTGFLVLHSDPVAAMHATTRQYVDAQDNLKVNRAGDALTGFLTLHSDPATPLHAATRQYVDAVLSVHALDDTRHLTAAQNTLLDTITVDSSSINQLTGISGNVQAQIDTKFDRAGGTVTGDITLSPGRTIFVSKVPASDTEVTNKAYVDSQLRGLKWEDPVSDINLVSDVLNTPPASPVINDVYIVGNSGTGAWLNRSGFATYFNGTSWVFLQTRPVQTGDRFGVSLTSSTVVSASLAARVGRLVTIVNATPGAITYTEDVTAAGSTTLVFDQDSKHFGVTFTLTDEGSWVATNTSVNIVPGDGLSINGNILNFNFGVGLQNINDVIRVGLDHNSGLNFLPDNTATLRLDGTTLSSTTAGVRVHSAVIADIDDKLSRTASSVVSGSVDFNTASSLLARFTPTTSFHVVNRGYVDAADSNLQTQITSTLATVTSLNSDPVTRAYVDSQDNLKVNRAGDTLTGFLTLHANPTLALHATTRQYVDAVLSAHAVDDTRHLTAAQNTLLDGITVDHVTINQLAGVTSGVQTQIDSKVNLTGGTLTGFLTLHAAPTANLHAATKQYVDAVDLAKVAKAGDTMTGPLVLSGDPILALHAAPRQYVDASIATLTNFVNTQDNTKLNLSGGSMTGFITLHANPTLALHAATRQYVDNSIITLTAYVDSRDNALQAQITTLQTTVTTLNTDPVTRAYVDAQTASRLALSGGVMTGYITLHADPQQNMHPATKQYVDAIAQGLRTKPSVRLATTVNLSAIYNNGSQGINATLTGAANGILTVDGIIPAVGDRVLVKNQTSALQNGDYVVQQVGTAGTPFILRRVELVNESHEVPGSYFYVFDGATLRGTGWVITVDNPITFTIGVDAISVNQFSGQGSIIAGDGLTMSGNTISVNSANSSRIVVNADNIDLAVSGVVPGNYTRVVVDGFGRVTTGANPNTLAGFGIIDGQLLNANLTSLSGVVTNGIVVRDVANNMVTREISASGVGLSITNGSGVNVGDIVVVSNATSAASNSTIVSRDASGNFAANVITAALTGNASSATILSTTRDFSVTGDVVAPAIAFNGSANVALNATLTNTGVVAGAYTRVSVDQKGRVVEGSNPSTVADMGLTDAATIAMLNQRVLELERAMAELHLYIMSRI